jgi:hypothetical protein
MVINYSILNVAGIRAVILVFLNKNSKMLRRIFQKELSLELVKEQLTTRATTSCLPREVQDKAAKLTGQPIPKEKPAQGKRGRCQECIRQDRKTQCYRVSNFCVLNMTIYFAVMA